MEWHNQSEDNSLGLHEFIKRNKTKYISKKYKKKILHKRLTKNSEMFVCNLKKWNVEIVKYLATCSQSTMKEDAIGSWWNIILCTGKYIRQVRYTANTPPNPQSNAPVVGCWSGEYSKHCEDIRNNYENHRSIAIASIIYLPIPAWSCFSPNCLSWSHNVGLRRLSWQPIAAVEDWTGVGANGDAKPIPLLPNFPFIPFSLWWDLLLNGSHHPHSPL